ncbi:regulator of G-protein signaling 9 isoform X1 [Oncorhynchus mykiss]|uniref:Regulator of G protein signaling 9a n=1 Tax=Oncorhynchus mykiss TaxID=8022 RepID=A0A8K9ULJ9_ONCMY|nr:regulator of G-protein signaling 9 isoform X1 [Oncorhynchus mykiss]
MTIRTLRDYGQHYRPRMACLKNVEVFVVEMQDPKSGVKGADQKLNVTIIPHVINGQDILAWIVTKMKVTTEEAQAFGTMLVAYGYIYPLQNHRKLVLVPDSTLYRFQTPYFWPVQKWPAEDIDYAIYLARRNIRKKGMLEPYEQQHYDNLHKWMNPKWDFIVMQATEQYKANKERKKPDRVVLDCQERAYWIVHRPPRRTHSAMDYGLDRLIDPNAEEVLTFDVVRRTNIFLTQALMRSAVKSSMSLTAFVKFVTTHHNHDPFLTTPVPSNPWITDSDEFWQLNSRSVDIPTKLSVERWVLSFWELISDPRGRVDFKLFLKKEHSAENMAFYEAAEEMRWGAASAIPEKSQFIFNTFLKPGAPRWINIDGRTMGLTVKGLVVPHRYVLDAAQTHIFLLMKKDTFYRYLKSPVHKDMQKRALVPAPHVFTDAQLEANVRNRNPGVSPILQWQQEEEEKAAAAVAARPIDVKAMVATNKLDRK